MKPTLNVYALPRLVEPEELAGRHGRGDRRSAGRDHHRPTPWMPAPHEVIPCLEVADALALAEQFPADEVVLGGERDGLPIDGFQLGNSPEEYTPGSGRRQDGALDNHQRHPGDGPRPAGRRGIGGGAGQRLGGGAAAGRPGARPHPLRRHRRTNQRGRRSAGRPVGRTAPAPGRIGLPAERPGDHRPRVLAPLLRPAAGPGGRAARAGAGWPRNCGRALGRGT